MLSPTPCIVHFPKHIALLSLCAWLSVHQAIAQDHSADLSQQVRSILSNRCFACHGPDEVERQGGFRLDKHDSMLAEADSGLRPVVPGDAQQSELLRRIMSSDEDERMPPADFGKPLSAADVQVIEDWIIEGAKLPEHWSFVAPVRPPLPESPKQEASSETPSALWSSHPVDLFVRQQQARHGMQPSPQATRAELLRRLSLDLIGLPPTLDEVHRFEQDTAPGAYERQVDRLLSSPSYGEHWARKWLDLARYADSAGYADDPSRTIWPYRDWVISALNDNMPIDQFTIEQLAGDLLPNPTQEQLVATAFHRNTLTNNEGGTNDEEFRSVAIVDRVNTTMAVWMGVTMACAQCHTHKYDPFTQEEYFKLYAIFNQTRDADLGDESPVLELYTSEQRHQQRQMSDRAQQLEAQLTEPTQEALAGFAQWQATIAQPEWTALVPQACESQRDSDVRFDADHSIQVRPTGNNIVSDTYTLRLRSDSERSQQVVALGLRTLPNAELPAGGAGTSPAGGNFVVTGLTADVTSEQLQLLDVDRKPLFEHTFTAAPEVSETLVTKPRHSIRFSAAYADYAQNGFPAANVIDADKSSGWAVGGAVASSHLLTLIPDEPFELEPSAILEFQIEHSSSHRHHLLGSFRVETSLSQSASQWCLLDDELIAILALPEGERTAAQLSQLERFYCRNIAPQNTAVRSELKTLQKQLAEMKPESSVPVMRELEESSRRETYIQIRGNYKSLDAKVEPGVPAVFHPLPGITEASQAADKVASGDRGTSLVSTVGSSKQPVDRLALARWLVDRRNPLTARVWVNRLWESLFGLGIVRSSEDFGAQGDRPTHPELLDWLACELMDGQWDNKRLLRLLVTSQTYRQTSRVTHDTWQEDQDNVWLARGPRVRLSAEMVRDQALSIAGLLSPKMYGPPVRPPQPNSGLAAAFGSGTDWQTSAGEDRYRRGLYTTWRRSNPYPSMATFDAPSREVCILRRDSTNTPLQALVTLNDPAFVEAAQALARRVVLYDRANVSDDSDRLQNAFELCTSRAATDAELQSLLGLLTTARQHFATEPEAAKQLSSDPLGPLDSPAQEIELAAWTSVCNVLLNLDEVLMKR